VLSVGCSCSFVLLGLGSGGYKRGNVYPLTPLNLLKRQTGERVNGCEGWPKASDCHRKTAKNHGRGRDLVGGASVFFWVCDLLRRACNSILSPTSNHL